jgi:DNA-binding SARP family transcriptional activator
LLEFRILGPIEVVRDRGAIRLGGTKQRATLAILLLNANQVVPIDRLADDLYAGTPPVSAVKQVQRQISDLRKQPGLAEAIETRSPGYLVRLATDQLDLRAFERLVSEAAEALTGGEPQRAADLLRSALRLWRGPALADLAYESFAQPAIERLEELRLAALEQRIDVELELGQHTELVGELDELVALHPLRERFRGQLMVALYRAGRQAEALDAYRAARSALVSEFGLEPGPELQELERQILRQDPALLPRARAREPAPARSVLVVADRDTDMDGLMSLVEPLTPATELIVARLVAAEDDLAAAAAMVRARAAALGGNARTAAFTTDEVARDAVRLATTWAVRLVVVSGTHDPTPVFEHSPADVAVVSGQAIDWAAGEGVFVPFGGTEHDWAALELGAWLASAANAPLRLVGTRADPSRGRRDASRLLANASIAVQRLVGVTGEPVLVARDAFAAAVRAATVVVAGVSSRWRTEGVGGRATRLGDKRPLVLVHAGPRPGGLAPRESRTRFSWSLGT